MTAAGYLAQIVRGDWSRAAAERVIDLVASENTRRVYGLPAG